MRLVCLWGPRIAKMFLRSWSLTSNCSQNGLKMASVKIECPSCHRNYNVAEKFLGRKVTCATDTCGATFLAAVFLPLEPIEDVVASTEGSSPSEKPLREYWNRSSPPLLRDGRTIAPKLPLIALAFLAVIAAIGFSGILSKRLGDAVPPDPARQQMIDVLCSRTRRCAS